jgi:hypothetical protein
METAQRAAKNEDGYMRSSPSVISVSSCSNAVYRLAFQQEATEETEKYPGVLRDLCG